MISGRDGHHVLPINTLSAGRKRSKPTEMIADAQLDAIEELTPPADGASAMVAYARLQFEDVPEEKRRKTREALLRERQIQRRIKVE